VTEGYFGDAMVNRQRMIWTVATRRQLERWEPIVAAVVLGNFAGRQPDGATVWSAAIEHHFALVAARNLLRALKLAPEFPVDPTLADDLTVSRNLHEHWEQHLPVFSRKPLVEEPKRSGKRFAARNPGRSPYWWLGWNPKTGALLQPTVSAPALHELLDAVESDVIARDAALSEYVPQRAPSPWLHEKGEWWPIADDNASTP
jgi:hypothetical protein